MDRIDRTDVGREESLQSVVPKDRCDNISTDLEQRAHFCSF